MLRHWSPTSDKHCGENLTDAKIFFLLKHIVRIGVYCGIILVKLHCCPLKIPVFGLKKA